MFISQNSVRLFQGAGSTFQYSPPRLFQWNMVSQATLRHFSLLLAHPHDTEQAEKHHKKEDIETKSRCCQRLKKQRVISCLAARDLPEKTWEFPHFESNVRYWCIRWSFSSTWKDMFLCLFLILPCIQRNFKNTCAYLQTMKHKEMHNTII